MGSEYYNNIKKIGIVVLNYNNWLECEKLIDRISQFKNIFCVALVDNLSTDDSLERFHRFDDNDKITVIPSRYNAGYAYGNNLGAKYLINNFDVDYVLICNPDILFDEDAVMSLYKFAEESHDRIGMLSLKMTDINGNIRVNFWKLPRWYDDILNSSLIIQHFCNVRKQRYFSNYLKKTNRKSIPVDVVAGSMFLIKSSAFADVGFFDEGTFLYNEENILSLKLHKKGYQNYVLLDRSYTHIGSTSISKNSNLVNRYKMYYKSIIYYHTYICETNNLFIVLLKFFLELSMVEKRIISFFWRSI